jgi:hypothetical protein
VRYPYYRCLTCRVNAPAREVEAAYSAMLERRASPPVVLDVFEEVIRERLGERRACGDAQLERLRAHLRRLTEAYLYEGVIDAAVFREERKKLQRPSLRPRSGSGRRTPSGISNRSPHGALVPASAASSGTARAERGGHTFSPLVWSGAVIGTSNPT